MHIKKLSGSRKKFITLTLITALLLITAGSLFMQTGQNNKNKITSKDDNETTQTAPKLTTQPASSDPSAKQTGITGPNIKTDDSSAGSAAFPTTQPNLLISIAEITHTGNTMHIKTLVEPSTKGKCRYTLTRDDAQKLEKETPINGITCHDTSLDTTGAKRGAWTLTATVFAGDNVSTDSKSVHIN